MIKNYKKDFPLFKNNKKIVYLDSGATSQKPKIVLDSISDYYKKINSNPYRGSYKISVESTKIYNKAREVVAEFVNAKNSSEIVFTKNATESLNLIAYSYGLDNLNKNSNVVLSIMEHHSNIVPWQKVTNAKGAELRYLYINEDFEIDDSEIENKIDKNTKIVGIVSVSNVLGTKNNLEKIIKKAHSVGAVVVVDASQSIAHEPFDVQKYDADFVVFSAHKMYGPLGIGVLYGKKDLLDKMSPFLLGGDMIEYVYEQSATYNEVPNKFEAGTQNVGGAIGLCSAIKYLLNIGYENIKNYENDLMTYAVARLKELPYIKLYTTSDLNNLSSVISFNVKNIHPHDVASILDSENVCIRAGNHCAQPLMRYLKIDSTCRISFSIYNTRKDIDKLIIALEKIYNMFKKFIKIN